MVAHSSFFIQTIIEINLLRHNQLRRQIQFQFQNGAVKSHLIYSNEPYFILQ